MLTTNSDSVFYTKSESVGALSIQKSRLLTFSTNPYGLKVGMEPKIIPYTATIVDHLFFPFVLTSQTHLLNLKAKQSGQIASMKVGPI